MGRLPSDFTRAEPPQGLTLMVPKNTKKSKAEAEDKNHRAAQKENKHGLACPECWTVPPTVRNDGFSTARHEPGSSGARKFRDTAYCNGQGRAGRYVLDKNWKPGHEPENSINGQEFIEHGLKLHEARQKRREEGKKGVPKAERTPKPPKAKKSKAKAGKAGKKPATGRVRAKSARSDGGEGQGGPADSEAATADSGDSAPVEEQPPAAA